METKLLNAIQEAVLNSNRASEAHIDGNISIIGDIPAYLANYNRIKVNIAEILNLAETKGASRKVATVKTDLRTRLNDTVLQFAGVVETFADDINDLQLRDDMKLSFSQVKRMRDDEIAPFCQFIHDRAQPHATALKDYNIQAADFTALQTLTSDYSAEAPQPRTKISQRKAVNAQIVALFKDNDKCFKKLDNQMKKLKTAHPVFVEVYFNTRLIIDTSSKPKPEEPENANNPPA
jgi:hypothetical protein